ncbi:MAG: glycosyltransferase family 39 protein [Burkholderiaceae bacterium]
MTGIAHLRRPTQAWIQKAASTQAPSGRLVAVGLLVFAAVWLVHLASTSLSPPVDNIEQLTWVRSLELGYYKHPPLPTWLLWVPVQFLGISAWTGALLGAAVTLAAMGVLWALLRALRGATYAALALLAALCITYYNGRLNYYNHNVVLLLTVVMSAWCCWRAFDDQRLRWWVALGVTLGLGALSKYQIAVTALSVLCFWASQRAWREPRHVRGLLVAVLTALAVFSPHLLWLPAHDFGPIRYAMGSSLGAHLGTVDRLANAGRWAADQLLNRGMPAILFLGACAWSASKRAPAAAAGALPPADAMPGSRALILSWAAVPMLFMPAMGVVLGSDLQLQWGTAFLPFVVPAAMESMPRAFWLRVRLAFAVKVFLALQGLLMLLSYATSPVGLPALKDHHWRTFPSQPFADAVAAPARALLGGPIRVIVGEPAMAGALALKLPERPLVLLDGDFDRSPWVGLDLLRRCGALQIGRSAQLPSGSPFGPAFPDMAWKVIKPTDSAPCPP